MPILSANRIGGVLKDIRDYEEKSVNNNLL